ncbi:MAG: response regulator transcription factor [Myxococcota bacterium]
MEGRQSGARVVIVDDHPVFRLGLKFLIDGRAEANVVGEGSCAADVRRLAQLEPDLFVIDLMLSDSNAIENIREILIHAPNTRILVVSMLDEVLYAERCVRAGAHGYLTKSDAVTDLVTAMLRVLCGDIYLGERVMRQIARRVAGGGAVKDPVASLSDREIEVFQLLGQGHRPGEIAEMLHLSRKTIESHQAKLKRKLGVTSSSELLRMALDWNRDPVGFDPV